MNAPPLIAGLLQSAAYSHPAPSPRLIETHISWVILAGEYAYKLKKPLDLGFLDFSTLDKRLACCREEVRLNRRLAPDFYLDVVAVTGSAQAPRMGGDGPSLEWAVKMRAFPADATLDREAEVTAAQIDAIADQVAAFHASIDSVAPDKAFGDLASIMAPILGNFEQLHTLLPPESHLLPQLEAWSRAEGARLAPHFATRKADGFVRECHGDLHLGNIAWVAGQPLIFDAIEFNAGLRCVDVISELAFLTMDLEHRGRADLAWRCLNRYLEHTGDYGGLAALAFYQVYRAMVRAKVTALMASQQKGDFSVCQSYLELAHRLTHRLAHQPALGRRPTLILMHGVSGSGKTWHSQGLLEALGAVRLRSDVERKRLFGLPALAASSQIPGGIYGQEAGDQTRQRLLDLARDLLGAGFPVIVDATFIRRDWREPFAALAGELGLPWFIVHCTAPTDQLRQRVVQRQARGDDASEAGLTVLEEQLAAQEPFSPDEASQVLDMEKGLGPVLQGILAQP